MNIALIIAGGTGNRMGQDIPKQFLSVYDKPVIVYTLEAFQAHNEIDEIAVVCLDGWEHVLRAYAKQFGISKLGKVVNGGKNGQDSIRNGLFELEKDFKSDDIVLIHDAIRPCVSKEIISDCIKVAKEHGAAVSCIPCAEAMLQTENNKFSTKPFARDKLKRTQTPQGFKLGKICNLHREALKKGITNSVASCTLILEASDEPIYFSLGSEKNVKLTTTDDLEIFKALLVAKKSSWIK